MTAPLDKPIWHALSTRHAALAEGTARAKRYPGSISPFASLSDDTDESLAELADLIRGGSTAVLLEGEPVRFSPAFTIDKRADGVQMVADGPCPVITDPRIVPLGWDDAQAMHDLAQLTKPGPFTLEALRLGRFWRIRLDGRLVAMAGERLAVPGMTEISGVCTHPDCRGQGLGRVMSAYVAGEITTRGEQPFLHAWTTNKVAIDLYASLGFRLRRTVEVAIVRVV
ncbi:MAG: GNAT family N-acetyltransferase [Labrys sp. (in: a-proteobacteria)]